jgi:Glycerophosphoryl diester phosphodiesterase family
MRSRQRLHAFCTPPVRPFPVWAVLLALVAWDLFGAAPPAPRPLTRAHAHNDYWHERPLLDAVDRGFCSVEADVFLKDGRLLVGHDEDELRPERTLEALYLIPLRERVERNGGRVHRTESPFYLLIDVKSDAEATYAALHKVLSRYSGILSSAGADGFERKAITAVLSGNRAQETLRAQPTRSIGIDGRPADLENDESPHVMPWISANWTLEYRWRGEGAMLEAERAKLREYVRKAHERGRLVRFWATPEIEAVWKELLDADVDLIGTDDLDRLQRFLIDNP